MRLYMRRFSFILLLILCSLLIFSCGPASDDGPVVQPEGQSTTGDVPTQTVPELTDAPGGLVRLKYYTVSASSHSIKNAVVLVGSKYEITPSRIIGLIVDSLEDQSVIVDIDSVSIIDGVCVIDFDTSIRSISEKDTQLENAILDACAQSILDNISDCTAVSYKIDGGAYTTDGHSFAEDQIYMGD